MSLGLDQIYDAALLLPADVRMSLIEKLLSSLNPPLQSDHERYWEEEAERRVTQIENGEVELVPGDEVFDKIREKYRK